MRDHEANRPLLERVSPDTAVAATAWIDARAAAGEDRFFLWVHFQDPHGPYTPPPELAARFDRGASDGPDLPIGPAAGVVNALPRYQVLPEGLAPGLYRDRYDAEVAYFDRGFATVVEALERAGWLDGSLVVFSADHGESLGEHGFWFCHGESVFRELVHVPLVVRYPEDVARPAAARVAAGVSHLDLWPTFGDALGLELAANRGTSLLAGAVPEGRTFLQTVRAPDDARRWAAVSDGRWRLVAPFGERPALFDVAADPGETEDLADRERDAFARLFRAWDTLRDGRAPALVPVVADSAARRDTLRGLGYVDGEDDADPPPSNGDGDGH
jgi:arylsulfatase A-like enzyme